MLFEKMHTFLKPMQMVYQFENLIQFVAKYFFFFTEPSNSQVNFNFYLLLFL